MTVPADAYVSFTAREAARQIQAMPDNPKGALVCGRTHGFFVLVARGPIADELERALDPTVEPLKAEMCSQCITPRRAVSGGLCERHAAARDRDG